MKVALWCIGKTEDSFIAEGFAVYQKRISNYLNFEYRELVPAKSKKVQHAAMHQQNEKDEVFKLLKAHDYLIVLDENGKEFSSTAFSSFLQKVFNETNGSVVFLAGGAYGFHGDIYKRANHTVSLSKMTFTHQMVRLIFAEQLYRAMTILKGEPYHHP